MKGGGRRLPGLPWTARIPEQKESGFTLENTRASGNLDLAAVSPNSDSCPAQEDVGLHHRAHNLKSWSLHPGRKATYSCMACVSS